MRPSTTTAPTSRTRSPSEPEQRRLLTGPPLSRRLTVTPALLRHQALRPHQGQGGSPQWLPPLSFCPLPGYDCAIIQARMAEPERTTSFAKNVEGLQHEE